MKSLVVILVAFSLSLSSVESKSDVGLLQELIRELKSVSADTVPDSDNLADPHKPAPVSDIVDPVDIGNPNNPIDAANAINGDPVEPVIPTNLDDLTNLDNPADQIDPIDATDAIADDKIESDIPTDPNALDDPTNPGEPTDPINPTNSDDSADPPSDTTELGEPTDPINPTNSDDSADPPSDTTELSEPTDPINPTNSDDSADPSSDTTELGEPTDPDQTEPIYISNQAYHANEDPLDPIYSIESQESEKPSDLEKSAINLARQVDKLTKLMFMKAEEMAKADAALQDSPAAILSETENVALEQERYELLAARLSEMRDSLNGFFGTMYHQLSGFSEQFEEPNSKESSHPKYGSKAVKPPINLLKSTAADPKKRNNEFSSSMLNRLLQAL